MKNKTVTIICCIITILFCISCKADSSTYSASINTESPIQGNTQGQKLPFYEAELAGNKLELMLARTHAEKSAGLMFYEDLPEKTGMLFVYSSPRIMSFWMYNTRIPLDLIFFSNDLMVTEWVKTMKPGFGKNPSELPRYLSENPAQYALELKAGSIEKLGISIGDRLDIPITLLYSE
ncbi:MAG: DUF192 domain-containing protein [Candidatus Rifleibacteriota bacterium]